jgi:hypothetical protein
LTKATLAFVGAVFGVRRAVGAGHGFVVFLGMIVVEELFECRSLSINDFLVDFAEGLGDTI